MCYKKKQKSLIKIVLPICPSQDIKKSKYILKM